MPIYTEVLTRITGKGSKKIYDWVQAADEDAGVFFAQVFGYDYENATKDDWDKWEYDFDSYRLGNACCSAHMEKDKSVFLHMLVCGSIPYGVFEKIAQLFPQIHGDGRFIQQTEEFFGNIVIENGGFLWTQFDEPLVRSGKEDFRFDSFFYEPEEVPDMDKDQKGVLALLKFDRDNMRTLLSEGKGFFRFHNEKKLKEYDYHSKFYFSEQELKAIAGDADCQYQIAQELLENKYFDNNPRIYDEDYTSREVRAQYFEEMGQSWLKKAAMNGNPDAQYRIARDYLYNDKDKEAKELFIFSLQNGSKDAFAEGEDDFGFDKEVLTVIEMMANQGSVSAMWALINYFDYFDQNDIQKHLKWLKKAVDCGDAAAMYELAGYLIEKRESQDDIDKAISLLEKASKLGDSYASHKMAEIYAKGEIVDKATSKALMYLEATAYAGDPLLSYESAKYLFACSEIGRYSFQSDSDREHIRSRLSDSYELAECFSGDDEFAVYLGIKKDSEKYIKWLNIAAQNGSAGAIFRLGKAYFEGKHVTEDYRKAFECFLICCNKKNHIDESRYYLGLMYRDGLYVPKNDFMAEKWFRADSREKYSNSNEESKKYLKEIRKEIKEEQLVADEKNLAQMKDYEKAVLLACEKKYDKAIAKFYELGDCLDSLQRINEMVPLFSQKIDELIAKEKYVEAQKALGVIPKGLAYVKAFWEESDGLLKPSLITKRFKAGDKGPAGGIIVYVKEEASDGWQYMEAASSAVFSRRWGKNEIIGTMTGIGCGKENTYKIIAANKGEKTAAQACIDYEQNGYKDWFLPSIDELSLLILPKDHSARCKYCDKHFGTRKVVSSSEADEFRVIGMKFEYMQMMKLGKDDYSLKCIPFRVF